MRIFRRRTVPPSAPGGSSWARPGSVVAGLEARPDAERRRGVVPGDLFERSADESFALAAFALEPSMAWLPCRLYVPADQPQRVVTAIVVAASGSGVSILAPSDVRDEDELVAVTLQRATGAGRLFTCGIAARASVHAQVTRFELRFGALCGDDQSFVRALVADLREASSGQTLSDAA